MLVDEDGEMNELWEYSIQMMHVKGWYSSESRLFIHCLRGGDEAGQ